MTDQQIQTTEKPAAEISPYTARVRQIVYMIEERADQIKEACVGGVTPTDLVSSLRKAIARDDKDKIIGCSDASIYDAMVTCGKLGIDPSGEHNSAHLIPYAGALTVQIGYGGYIELLTRSGDYIKVDTEVVYEGEEYEFHRGTRDEIVHKIDANVRNSTDTSLEGIVAAYAIATHKSGAKQWVFLSKKDILAAKNASKKSDDGPWKYRPAEMVKKSAVRALAKWMVLDKLGKLATSVSDEGDGYDFTPTTHERRKVANEAVSDLESKIDNLDKTDPPEAPTRPGSRELIDEPKGVERDPDTGDIIPDHVGKRGG